MRASALRAVWLLPAWLALVGLGLGGDAHAVPIYESASLANPNDNGGSSLDASLATPAPA